MLFLCNVKTNTICFQFSQFGQHNCCVICLRKLSPLTEVISTSNGVLEASLAPWDWVGGWVGGVGASGKIGQLTTIIITITAKICAKVA